MSTEFQEEAERFVDVPVKAIPPADTWHTLSIHELIDVKNDLIDKQFAFRSNKNISHSLTSSIARLEKMILGSK